MSLYKYTFTEIAALDIEAAITYIDEKLCNKKAAVDLYNHLNDAIRNVCEFPYMYEDCSQFLIPNETIRRAIVDNYIMIYEVDDEGETVVVLRFLHQTRNIKELGLS